MPIVANGKYYIIKANNKYYDILNPFAMFTFTIAPTPSDATVTLTASGYTQVGNSITVRRGTTVNWSVSKTDYVTQTGSQVVSADETKNIVLEAEGYPDGYVVFESSTPGTYNVELLYSQDYEIWMVGGGASGAYGESPRRYNVTGGGSGAYINGVTNIDSGIYQVIIASGGVNSTRATTAGGGTTSFLNQEAKGGENQAIAGFDCSGGSYTITLSGLTGTNGNTGVGLIGSSKTQSGAASVYGGYGKGGDAKSSPQSGGDGYFKIVARR